MKIRNLLLSAALVAISTAAAAQNIPGQAISVSPSPPPCVSFGTTPGTCLQGATGGLPVGSGGTGDTGTAWTAYVPTIACGSGSVTTATATGRWKSIGKTIFINLTATLTTIGTCTGGITLTLPVAPQANGTLLGQERSTTGFADILSYTAASMTSGLAAYYNNTSAFTSGTVLNFTGTYESQ